MFGLDMMVWLYENLLLKVSELFLSLFVDIRFVLPFTKIPTYKKNVLIVVLYLENWNTFAFAVCLK